MTQNGHTDLPLLELDPHAPPQAEDLGAGEAMYGTLVLDRHGRIVSCGEAAAHFLCERANRLRGRDVADFVCGLSLGGTSARYRAGYLDYLAANPTWRELEVCSGIGGRSAAWFRLSPIVAEGQRLFLLAMRRMDANPGAEPVPALQSAQP